MHEQVSLEWLFSDQSMDLIVLNTPGIEALYEMYHQRAEHVIVTDGASNYVKAFLEQTKKPLMPTYIVGDMDSITDESRGFFEDVEIVVDTNPGRTDLEKALLLTSNDYILILGDINGRLDHLFQVFSCLCRYHLMRRSIFFLGETNLAFPVSGNTQLLLHDHTYWKYYGLFPLNGPAQVTTSGLKWDLNEDILEMGGLISSSNEALGNSIQIQTSGLLLFTCSK